MPAEIAVLLYHHVGPVREDACKGLTVDPRAFQSQMRALAVMGYSTITPSEWNKVLAGTRPPPERSVIITFDDGYADLIEHAFPVLQRQSFSATVFLPSSLLGRPFNCSARDSSAEMELMNAEDVREWARRGMCFGAHSRTHHSLVDLDDATLEREVRDSGREVSDLTGEKADAFAYPYGDHDARVRECVKRHFECAFTVEEGLNDVSTDRWSLNRTMVQHADSMVDVCLRSRYGRSVLQSAKSKLATALRPRSS